MPIELRQLHHVLALADLGSFARAAASLRLSQPALTRSIQRVEGVLGAPLFLRRRSGTLPTDAGWLFIDRARQVAQMSESLTQEALADRAFQYGHVVAGSGPYPAETVLAPAIARFIGAGTHVTAQLVVGDWDDLARKLERREIEFFVAETSTLQKDPHFAIQPMAAHPLYLVARGGHPLAGRRNVSMAEAFAYPLVSPSRVPPRILEAMRAIQRGARAAGAKLRAFPAAECASLGVAAAIVGDSDAIMAAPLACIAADLDRRRLVVLGSEPWLKLHYGIVELRGSPRSAAARRLVELVRAQELEVTLEEQRLVTRWTGDRGLARDPPRPARRKRRR